MKIKFDNVNFQSRSGPNSFAMQLAKELSYQGHHIVDSDPDVQLSFIVARELRSPLVLRLDGIYFNTEQDWMMLNSPIKGSYEKADAVIVQSQFNKRLVRHYFGDRDSIVTIRNGTDKTEFDNVVPASSTVLDEFENVWMCASSWRPHKRLAENIRYFLEVASQRDCLVVAGSNPDHTISNPRVFYTGDVDRTMLLSLYKRARYFIHLAFLDHCPNVVVDARAAGCDIICASSGGTREIAGPNATVIADMEWDMQPLKLYEPPLLDFSCSSVNEIDNSIDIVDVAREYAVTLQGVL